MKRMIAAAAVVAFIPRDDSAAPLETMDCPTAGTNAHIICTSTQIR